jgi:hypothetical protein
MNTSASEALRRGVSSACILWVFLLGVAPRREQQQQPRLFLACSRGHTQNRGDGCGCIGSRWSGAGKWVLCKQWVLRGGGGWWVCTYEPSNTMGRR